MLYRDPKEGPEAEEVKAPADELAAGGDEGAGDNANAGE